MSVEAPTEICTGVTTETIIDRGYCYRRIEGTPDNLIIASFTCNSYNGALYTFNDSRLNMRLYSSYKASERSFWLQDPLQYNLSQPQQGYFNLRRPKLNYPANAECRILTENGMTVGHTGGGGTDADRDCEDQSVDGDDNCPACDVNYICRIG